MTSDHVTADSHLPLPYSPSFASGGLLFVSGQASVDETGAIVPDTFKGEMLRSFANLSRILGEAGLDFSDIVQVRSYVRRPENIDEYNAIYRELFNKPYPARTTLTGCLPDTIQFEVDVIARVKSTV